MDSQLSTNVSHPPAPVAFGNCTANARFPFHGQVYVDLLQPYTSGPNDEWALPPQHVLVSGIAAAEALRDFLTAAIDHAKTTMASKPTPTAATPSSLIKTRNR